LTQKHPEQLVGRYAIFDQIAAGGMARVHLARFTGQEGFSLVVAVKRMHPHLLENADFKAMFLDEARLAARIRHPNVVPILDVIATSDELLIVMEYVHGVSVHALMRLSVKAKASIPRPVVFAILTNALHGLHAAHEARDQQGELLGLVHRDVSPQNVLVGVDGVARVLDFGVAKAVRANQDTDPGMLKGKHSYMAPELIEGGMATRQSDVFSAATLFWELLTGRKLFHGTEQERLEAILMGNYPSPKKYARDLPPEIERIALRGIAPKPADRYASALEMAIDLETHAAPATARVVGEWVSRLAAEELGLHVALIHQIETSSTDIVRISEPPPEPRISASPTAAFERPPEAVPAGNPRLKPWLWVFAALLAVSLVSAIGWVRNTPPAQTAKQVANRAPQAFVAAAKAERNSVVDPAVVSTGTTERGSESLPGAVSAAVSTAPPAPESVPAASASLAPRLPAAPGRPWRAPSKPKEFLPNEL
jgi:eukaryotic-like serine/threonine-protein kinase